MPESSSRSFPTVPTALSALTARPLQSMTPDAPLPHPPSLGAGALLRWLLRRAAVPVTLATLAACTSNIIQAIVPAFLGQALDAGIEDGLNAVKSGEFIGTSLQNGTMELSAGLAVANALADIAALTGRAAPSVVT